MITNAVLGLVTTVVTAISSFIPSVSFPSWLTDGTLLPSGVATNIGELIGSLAFFAPIETLLTILTFLLTLWPAVAAYFVFSWVWRHVPTIAGFGTGNA